MSEMPPINFSNIDSAVHGPVRLGVLTALQSEGELDFTTIKKRLGVVDGAIGAHLQKLENIGYILCKKEFVGRRPRSSYRISSRGRKALMNYLETMQTLLDAMKLDPNS